MCEVLSPATRARDVASGDKGRAYREAGVDYYWLVDLEEESITVYQRKEGCFDPIEIAGRDAEKVLPPFETVRMQVRRVFVLARALKAEGG